MAYQAFPINLGFSTVMTKSRSKADLWVYNAEILCVSFFLTKLHNLGILEGENKYKNIKSFVWPTLLSILAIVNT